MPTSLLGPWIAGHALGIGFLALVLKWTVPARWALSGIFLVSAVVNTTLAAANPRFYVGLAPWAFDAWAGFISGPYADSPIAVLLAVAAVQLLVTVLLVVGRERGSRLGLFLAAVFFVLIAPLGLGAAFPATLLFALGAVLLFRSDLRQSLVDELRAYHPPPRHPVHTIAEVTHPHGLGRMGHVRMHLGHIVVSEYLPRRRPR